MKAAVAGTFDVLHDGHKTLINKAFELGDSVLVGITSDRMASQNRDDTVPLYIREINLKKYLDTLGKPYTLSVIDDLYGPVEMDTVDVLVVSAETFHNAEKIRDERRNRGIKPLDMVVVPIIKAADGKKINASDILKGKYAKNGKIDVPDIVVGSVNHVKVEAVRSVMERIFENVKITAIAADSGVSSQPFEMDTRQGAINRAKNSLGSHDIAVGIEAGVFEMPDGLYDFQYCAILDRDGKLTIGTGMGFKYPDSIAKLVRNGYTVGDAIHQIYGNMNIGQKQGAIGLLSKGLIDRKSLTEQSVMAAMIPRIWDE
jgi:inosine/xanthosine triphosphatase